MSNDDLRYDSVASGLLSNSIATFSAIRNSQTGIGTGRSKTESGRVNSNLLLLGRDELEVLPYQDELIGRALWLFPLSAVNAWFHLAIADVEEGDQLPDQILEYLDNLGEREDQTPEEANADIYDVREAFLIASVLGCQFGKAYILMGIDDGRGFEEPIDYANIRSLRWLQVYDKWDMRPERTQYRRRTHTHYRLVYGDVNGQEGALIHKSRLLPFYGNRIYSRRSFATKGVLDDGISSIQGMFDAWRQWTQGEKAGAEMLADYDVFALGMKGLAIALEKDRRDGTTSGQEAILSRALVLDQGKSTTRGIIYDLDNENPDSITRSYGGAKDIMEALERRFIAVTGIPRSKLFGEIGGQGLTNNQGLAARSEWAILTQVWSNNKLAKNMKRLAKITFLAKDSPTKGELPSSYSVTVPFNVPLTNLESMDFELKAAKRSQVLTGIGAIFPKEVRTGYRGSTFNPDIMLDEDLEAEDKPLKPLKENQNGKRDPRSRQADNQDSIRLDAKLLSDQEWENLANVTAADFVEVARDVSDQEG